MGAAPAAPFRIPRSPLPAPRSPLPATRVLRYHFDMLAKARALFESTTIASRDAWVVR